MLKLLNYSFLILLMLVLLLNYGCSLPTPEEDRYFEKQLNRELLNWLQTLQANRPLIANPCNPLYGVNTNGIGANQQLTKRNSELINSLLGLPKNLNDAGK